MGKFDMAVQSKAQAKQVYDFLASEGIPKMKVKSADPALLKVSLKTKVGLFSYGEIVECTIVGTEMGCRVNLEGRPVLATNITADVKETVLRVSEALVGKFGGQV